MWVELLGVGAAVAGLGGAVLGYYGAFKRVQFKIEDFQEIPLCVATWHVGDYSKVGKPMDEVYDNIVKESSIKTTKGFGIYLDNPNVTPKDKCRAIVGCILDSTPSEVVLNKIKEKYVVFSIPSAKNSSKAEFPMKGFISIILGVIKVYPAMHKHFDANPQLKGGVVLEIYDTPNKKISYISLEGITDKHEALTDVIAKLEEKIQKK